VRWGERPRPHSCASDVRRLQKLFAEHAGRAKTVNPYRQELIGFVAQLANFLNFDRQHADSRTCSWSTRGDSGVDRYERSSSRQSIQPTIEKPRRSRIGRDISPALTVRTGVPRLTAASQRARTSARYAPRPR
jgi:hypothetical protein